MKYIVLISPKIQANNLSLLKSIEMLNYKNIKEISTNKIYAFKGNIGKKEIYKIADVLLVDPIVEVFSIVQKIRSIKDSTIVNIWYRPEVLDVEALYISKAIKYINIKDNLEIHSGISLKFTPKLKKEVVADIIKSLFMNPLIQYYEII